MAFRAVVIIACAVLGVLIVNACTTLDSLKPGAPRGTLESGFMKTTEGLSLTVRDRSYDDVWSAAMAAMEEARKAPRELYTGPLAIVDQDKRRGVIRAEEISHLGIVRGYVGVFISPTTPSAPAYVVEVSKIRRQRTGLVSGTDWEAHLLRAIQSKVGGTP
jgi:hypothetical protein